MVRRKLQRRIFQKNKRLLLAAKLLGGGFLFFVLSAVFLFFYYAKDLPRPEIFTEKSFVLPTGIYDREGKVLLYQIFDEEKRTLVSSDKMPDYLKNAAIATEDSNFYSHFGIDFKGIFRAVIKDVLLGRATFGGSTISQQLVRSSLLSQEKTVARKIKEVILTLELERRYSKDQILEFYLNQVPFGSNAYGVEAAAQTYFKKPASELSLAQAAILVSLIKAPSYLSPYGGHKPELLARKDYILDKMANDGYISRDEADAAKAEVSEFAEIRHDIKAPHFVLYIKQYLEENYSPYFLREKGLKVYTSLDWELQELAEKSIKDGVARNKAYNANNAALTAIDPKTGEVLALVGSADYFGNLFPDGCEPGLNCQFEPSVNIALFGKGRQPGSAFKPFAYALAFQNGLGPETWIWDVKTEFNPDCPSSADAEKDQYGLECYHPKNYDEKFRGQTTLRSALAQSVNVPAVKVLYLAGLENTINLAKQMGITTLNNPPSWYGLSLVLGGGEVKLLDMVSAYSVFATEGLQTPPVFILKVEDSDGNVIEENKKSQKRVLAVQTARLMNDVLSDNEARSPLFGPYSSLYFPDYRVAAKTGTTQNYKDAWTIGYTNSLAAGVWAGNNDGTVIDEKPGVALAAPIWHKFMEKALKKYPPAEFQKPEPGTELYPAEIKPLEPHSLIYYLKEKPDFDPQYQNWEEAIRLWLAQNIKTP